ncbi:hypothetical protein A3K79_03575 [Candidatus Bathyarchaeota archaeon RBG_13_46_16b]|nr:MAG: hypothetical protein A3K79_03575 [Candidatus Bathyarchaeota archaeon RBG_13_46_16b]
MYGYVICEYEKVRQWMPEFASAMAQLKNDLIAKASDEWNPLTYGGMQPRSGQFGESTIMPNLFNGLQAAYQPLPTWYQWLNATGHQTIMTGTGTGGSIHEDYMIGLAGLVFLSKAIRISEIRMQIGDKKIPRINIEEAFAYNKPAVVFEQPFIIDEETGFDLYAYVLSQGPERIKLLGLEMNRVPNKLQVSNTGVALT